MMPVLNDLELAVSPEAATIHSLRDNLGRPTLSKLAGDQQNVAGRENFKRLRARNSPRLPHLTGAAGYLFWRMPQSVHWPLAFGCAPRSFVALPVMAGIPSPSGDYPLGRG